MVVISGPEATAGSIWIFLKNIGISVPTRLDISIASISAAPIQSEMLNENSIDAPLKSGYSCQCIQVIICRESVR